MWIRALLLVLLAGCGYHFPGEQPAFPPWLRHAALRVERKDVWENPSLAKHLEFRLRQRLNQNPSASHEREVVVTLLPRQDAVLTVQNTGRANRRQIVLQATMVVTEGEKNVGPVLASAEGRALFSEAPGTSPLQSRVGYQEAETEAVERLTESIAAVLATIP